MAIDNLHTRCLEGIKRIKDDAKKEDKINEKPDKKKGDSGDQPAKTKTTKEAKEARDNNNAEEATDNYHLKGIVIEYWVTF